MTNSETGAERDSKFESKSRNAFVRYLGTADAWTALATIFLVLVGIWGVLETKKTLELSERAWLSPVGGQMLKAPEKTKGIHFAINFTNSGREPATDLNIRFRNFTIDAYDPEYTDLSNIKVPENDVCLGLEPARRRAVIAPNVTFAYTLDTLRGEPAYIADEAIIKGTKFLVVVGCAAYKAFERTRYTSFCYIVESTQFAPQNQNLTVVLTPGQPPISVPVTTPAPPPSGGRNYNFVACAAGFEVT